MEPEPRFHFFLEPWNRQGRISLQKSRFLTLGPTLTLRTRSQAMAWPQPWINFAMLFALCEPVNSRESMRHVRYVAAWRHGCSNVSNGPLSWIILHAYYGNNVHVHYMYATTQFCAASRAPNSQARENFHRYTCPITHFLYRPRGCDGFT